MQKIKLNAYQWRGAAFVEGTQPSGLYYQKLAVSTGLMYIDSAFFVAEHGWKAGDTYSSKSKLAAHQIFGPC